MDARAMMPAVWLLAGLAVGAAHFALLRRNTLLFLDAGGFLRALVVQALRIAAVAAALTFAAWHGALPLLLAALGVVIARPLIVRTAAP